MRGGRGFIGDFVLKKPEPHNQKQKSNCLSKAPPSSAIAAAHLCKWV